MNAARGLLAELGVVAGKGIQRLDELRRHMDDLEAELFPDEACTALNGLFAHVDALYEQVATIDARLLAWHRGSAESQRLASAPGVGPMTASAIVAEVGDGQQFQSAGHFAACLGLTPRIKASGGKEHIGRISKGGDRYLRTLLIHGARAVVGTSFRKDMTLRPWLKALIGRRPVNVAATAVAHQTARALWAMLTRAKTYRRPAVVAATA